jgi:threonine dehydratase
VLIVREDSIEDSIAVLLEIEKTLCEGAGAAGVAAVLEHPNRFRGKRVGVVLCGGNIDMNVLSAVLQRALVRRGRVIRLLVTTLDASGVLAEIASVIAAFGGNIRHVAHDRTFAKHGAKTAVIAFDIEIQDANARGTIRQEIERRGMHVEISP